MATVTKENDRVEAQREWSDLPIDVVGCIVGKLYWADRIRFAAVCKAWNVPPRGILPIMEERPWMLSFIKDGPENSIIKLLDPYQKKDYVVQEFHGEVVERISGIFWASRYGWIMCNKLRDTRNVHSILSTLLFSPFTREIVEFPELEVELEKGAPWAIPYGSFFINPASPECVVYVIWRKTDWVWMATCSPGDTAWKTFKFPLAGFMEFWPYGVTYLAGSFYTISQDLDVGVFNLATQEWRLLKPSGLWPRSYTSDGTVVHSDFDLLWYEYQNVEGLWSYTCTKVVDVWRFDFLENRWFKEDKFGNHTIFSTQMTTYSVRGVEKGKYLAGMVFADDQFVSVKGENNVSSEGWSYASFYEWMVKEKKSKKLWNMWIDPRPVWRKSDLIKQFEEVLPAMNI